jgi:hypothetical protein
MTLKEIVSKLTDLESGFKSLFSAKDENAEVVALRDSLAAIQSTVSGQLTELSTLNASLKTEVETLSTAASATSNALTEALVALNIEATAEATSVEKITALSNGVSATIAKLNVKASEIPVAGVKAAAAKSLSMSSFLALNHAERMAFVKVGGKVTE